MRLFLRTSSYFKIGRNKDYLLFPNLTVYCLFSVGNRIVFWWNLFSLGPFQPVVSSIGNRMTYCENFGEKTYWAVVKIITLNWRELLFIKISDAVINLLDNFEGQRWRNGESTRLPPMSPGFHSRRWRHMWVLGVLLVLSLAPRGFSPRTPIFPCRKKQALPKIPTRPGIR